MESTPPVVAPTNEVETHDDLGYEITKEETPAAPATEVAAPVEVPAEVKIEKSTTGYGDPEVVTPPVVVTPVEVPLPADATDEQKLQKEITDAVKALGDGYNKEQITKFALDNKLSKVQLDAYVKMTKDEDAAFVKSQEEAKVNQRKVWKEELQADTEFGKDFVKNVDRVEKVLQNNMPNTKKMLTEKGGVLPPYIMKDLLSIAKALNPTTSLVSGEAPAPAQDDSNFLDDMYS